MANRTSPRRTPPSSTNVLGTAKTELVRGAASWAPLFVVMGMVLGVLRYWDATPITHSTAVEIVRTEIKPVSTKVDDLSSNVQGSINKLTEAARQNAIASLERDIANLIDARGRNAASLASLETQITKYKTDAKLIERRVTLETERADIDRQLNAARDRLDKLKNAS